MPDDAPTSERLDALRARWESDRSSGVFLQLADEYRRLGRPGDAVVVLEEGLSKNPNHPAALVALGRCRLALGRADEATEVLEKVIAGDPTQMVAYRLLVEAYVERGMPEEARQRLRVYSLLNDSDPEIAELRRRIGEIERRHRDAPEPVEPEAAEEPGEESAPASGGDVERPDSACAEAPGAPADGGETDDRHDPFPTLAGASDRDRYLTSLSDGLFGAGSAPVSSQDAGEPEPLPGAEPAAASAPGGASDDDLFGLGAPREAPPPDLSSLFGEPTRQEAPSAPAPPEIAAVPAEEPAFVQEPEPEPDSGPEPESEPAPVPPSPVAPDAAGRPTVTLGRLYLRQGHRDEAAAIFREVLERDPANAEARSELDALEAPAQDETNGEADPLTAAELLADWHGGRDPEGMTARKRHVLERYLDRIRGRSGRDVH